MKHRIVSNLICAVTLLVGVVYLTRAEPMPYHKQFLGVDYASLPATVREFIMGLIHMMGCFFVCISILLKMQAGKLTAERAQSYCRFVVTATIWILFPLQYFTIYVGHGSPWWLITVLIGLCFLDVALVKQEFGKRHNSARESPAASGLTIP